MAKCKVKKVAMPSPDETESLNDMFSQMTGLKNSDPDIIIPKLCSLLTKLQKYSKVYKLLLGFKEFISKFSEYTAEFDSITTFIKKLDDVCDIASSEKNKYAEMSADEINTMYKTLKTATEVKSVVITSSNLGHHKKSLMNKESLCDDFIKREPGVTYKPLHFTNLDLKVLWTSNNLTKMDKTYILNILSHTYLIGTEVYKLISSPDIDIRKFSNTILSSIEQMKKQIPRCDKAFDIIANSINTLETNFDTYYKSSVESENPSIIIESFILDVSLNQSANATITSQFRKIIMFIKKKASNTTDPKIKQLFKILNGQFAKMEKETGTDETEDAIPSDAPKDTTEPCLPDISKYTKHDSSKDTPEPVD